MECGGSPGTILAVMCWCMQHMHAYQSCMQVLSLGNYHVLIMHAGIASSKGLVAATSTSSIH